jgi:hypothetical protein
MAGVPNFQSPFYKFLVGPRVIGMVSLVGK